MVVMILVIEAKKKLKAKKSFLGDAISVALGCSQLCHKQLYKK